MEELLKAFAPYGPGAVMAAVMMYFYRTDSQKWQDRLQSIIENNTKAMTELTASIRHKDD